MNKHLIFKTKYFPIRRIFSSLGIAIAMCLVFTSVMIFSVDTAHGATDNGYITESFVVDVNVDKDCTYNVTEKISVNFLEARRGIFRYIPYTPGNSKISDIKVKGGDVEISDNLNTSSHQKVIRIGDPDKFLKGRHEYEISYKITGIDNDLKPIKSADEKGFSASNVSKNSFRSNGRDILYIDLIPTEWQTDINYIKVNMTMPKEVDWDKVKIFTGTYGRSDGAENLNVKTDGKTLAIEGVNWPTRYGVTAYSELGKGYWENVFKASSAFNYIYVVMIAVAAISVLLWIFFGRDKKPVQTVEFYPPEGITPMEAGYIIDGSIDTEDRVSYFVYGASRGYMNIAQDKDDQKKFKFTKTLDDKEKYEKEKSFVRLFIEDLFATREEVSSDDLPMSFTTLMNVRDNVLRDYYTGAKSLFTVSSSILRILSWVMLVGSLIFILGHIIFFESVYIGNFAMVILGIADIILTVLILSALVSLVDRKNNLSIKRRRIRVLMLGLLSIASIILTLLLYAGVIGLPILGLVVILTKMVGIVMGSLMSKRTEYSTDLIGKLLGFKDFIAKAELPMIKSLVEENPSYFYDILPYAYVFGLTDKWVKNFEGIEMAAPSWYTAADSGMYNMAFPLYMTAAMNNMNAQIKDSMQQNIATSLADSSDSGGSFFSGGGGFGGGGFSGGGFGGGGGGAW